MLAVQFNLLLNCMVKKQPRPRGLKDVAAIVSACAGR